MRTSAAIILTAIRPTLSAMGGLRFPGPLRVDKVQFRSGVPRASEPTNGAASRRDLDRQVPCPLLSRDSVGFRIT